MDTVYVEGNVGAMRPTIRYEDGREIPPYNGFSVERYPGAQMMITVHHLSGATSYKLREAPKPTEAVQVSLEMTDNNPFGRSTVEASVRYGDGPTYRCSSHVDLPSVPTHRYEVCKDIAEDTLIRAVRKACEPLVRKSVMTYLGARTGEFSPKQVTCEECGGTGEVELFNGKVPCSKGCKPK